VYCDFILKILMESPHSSCIYPIISLLGISGRESTHSNPQTPKSNKSDGREDDGLSHFSKPTHLPSLGFKLLSSMAIRLCNS
jgi:hypothetical protein